MWTIALDKGGGSGGTSYIFEDDSKTWWAEVDWSTSPATGTVPLGNAISTPTPVGGFAFKGYYSASSGGTQYIDADGKVLSALTSIQLQVNLTIYAQYERTLWTLTLDRNGGSGGSTAIYNKVSNAKWYYDTDLTTEASSVSIPYLEEHSFLGYYSASSGGSQYIDANGNILTSLPSLSADRTIYAQWQERTVKYIDLNANGGSGGTARIYKQSGSTTIYADEACSTAITSVSLPTKPGKTFNGYYNSTTGSTRYVTDAGAFTSSLKALTADKTIYAKWTVNCYVLFLDANGGTGLSKIYCKNSTWYSDEACTTAITSIATPTRTGHTFAGYKVGSSVYITADGVISTGSISADATATAAWTANTYVIGFDYNGGTWYPPYTTQKTVTFGQAVGELPTTTREGRTFDAWVVGTVAITAESVWNIDSNMTAVAKWHDFFGGLTDYFGLDGNLLMLVKSENGEGRQVTNLWNGAYEQGDALLNPVCTYRVKASGTISVKLGQAFAKGYFITEAEYQTGADREPLLVVGGTANEGADAINTYSVAFAVDPDHVAQDPFSAISGGGELVEMSSAAKCDAVVPYEDNKPCASDVVHGRLHVTGRTAAYFGESKPTFRSSFIGSGEPASESDVDFTSYAFTAEKGI